MRNDTRQILEQLDSMTSQLPVDQLLSELQLAVERISFSQIHLQPEAQNAPITLSQIDLLMQDEISQEMLSFIHWLANQHMLALMSDNNGILFLNYCIKIYKQSTQVRFITAIFIDVPTKENVRTQLGKIYSTNARVIFDISPSIIGGFIITDGTRTVDRSLRSAMQRTVRHRIYQTTKGVPHG